MNLFYDSGKRYDRKGNVIIKGIPYVNEEKQKIKLERKQRKEQRKLLKKEVLNN